MLLLLAAVLLELHVLMDWAYQRGRSDLYAQVLEYRVQVDSVLKSCPLPKGAP